MALLQNFSNVFAKSLTINGFIFYTLEEKYGEEFYQTIPAQLVSGKLKFVPHGPTQLSY
jgi:NADPH-dependent curcumin reductase CurA